MKKVDSEFTPFCRIFDKKKLQKYHYKVMMPYFEDAEKLNKFALFDKSLKVKKALKTRIK